jgi:hypothetical protein
MTDAESSSVSSAWIDHSVERTPIGVTCERFLAHTSYTRITRNALLHPPRHMLRTPRCVCDSAIECECRGVNARRRLDADEDDDLPPRLLQVARRIDDRRGGCVGAEESVSQDGAAVPSR